MTTLITLAPVNIVHVILLSIATLAFVLVSPWPQCKALQVFLGLLILENTFNLLEDLGITRDIYLVTPALMLAYGPAYYLFTKNLVYGELSLKKHWVHFIPAMLALPFTQWWLQVLQVGFVILVVYVVITVRLLARYHRELAEVTADNESYTLRWLSKTMGAILFLAVVDFTRLNLQMSLSVDILRNWYLLSTVLTLSYSCYLIVMAVWQPILYSGIADYEKNVVVTRETARAPSPSSTAQQGGSEQVRSEDEADVAIFASIDAHVRATRAYSRAKYSLVELAEEVGLDQRAVSWAINSVGQRSFSDYINAFRVAEVKAQLEREGSKCNLLEAGLNAGFNSKSSFNAVFKKHTGCSPSQFIRNLKGD